MKEYQKYEIENIVKFEKNSNGLTRIVISNAYAEAIIYLHGANLTHFQPGGESAVIFGGRECKMHPDKTLHAGIPICWPWFGPHPTDSGKPQHGFARTMQWEVKEVKQLQDGTTDIVLGLHEDEYTMELFSHPFELSLSFNIGKQLHIDLHTYNSGTQTIQFTQALHSYFALSDIDNATIYGVEGVPFSDLTDGYRKKSESAPLHIDRIINRIYEPTDKTCRIVDTGAGRIISIDKEGSNSTTIWNPGKHNGLHDLPGDSYRKFVCIETCNAGSDIVTLKSGASHRITQKVKLEKYNRHQ